VSLRRRLTLLSALAVALAVVVASVIIYALVRDQLRSQIDDTLRERAGVATIAVGGAAPAGQPGTASAPVVGAVGAGPAVVTQSRESGSAQRPNPIDALPPEVRKAIPKKRLKQLQQARTDQALNLPAPPDTDFLARGQLINAQGKIEGGPIAPGQAGTTSQLEIPVSDQAKEVAAGTRSSYFSNATVNGQDLRVMTVPAGPGVALQVARSLAEVNNTLSDLTVTLILISIGGIALAAGLGLLVARTSLAPAAAVSEAASEVAETKDLTRRIDVKGTDELASMATSFNLMLEALEHSVGAQRRLVADASHELRTPLATLRTNIETLERQATLTEDERQRVLDDLNAEMEELTSLVGDVVELAREPAEGSAVRQDVRLDELAAGAVDRARRRGRGLEFTDKLEPMVVSGDPTRLDRAISNLLDNAIKWSPEGGTIEVSLAGGRLEVRDHGPGFGEDDLPHAFERFYRADDARGMPGSGLGLAIVQRIVSEHGGTATVVNAPDGGAAVSITLPELDPA
jgi:two-component system, OmpR family, sensor histidine kinase MprB